MLAGHDIICISDLTWDAHWGTEQQFMSRLSRSNRVLFINEPKTRLTPFKNLGSKSPGGSEVRSGKRGVEERETRLYLASLPPVWPLRFSRLSNLRNTRRYVGFIKRWARELDFRSPILWIYEPSACGVSRYIDHSLLIYHCLDCWTGHKDWWNSDRAIERNENKLVAESDVVITVSRSLQERKVRLNPNTYFVPNAADYAHFSRAAAEDLPIAQEVSGLKKPVIGFIGVIGDRFDSILMSEVAKAYKKSSILLVGPIAAKAGSLDEFLALPNVYSVGMKPISQLPAYLKVMDACVIPYKSNQFTDNCFPLKLFEYLAGGKGIVSTDIPALREYGEFVSIALNKDEFIAKVKEIFNNHSELAIERRLAYAKENSWENRIEQVSEIIAGKSRN